VIKKIAKNHRVYILYLAAAYLVGAWINTNKVATDIGELNSIWQYLFITIVVVFFTVIWLILGDIARASYDYANKIKGSREHAAFSAISKSIILLLVSLILTAFMSVLKVPPVNDLYKILTVSIYYTSALLAVAFFYYIGKAGNVFAKYLDKQKSFMMASLIIAVSFGSLCLLMWLLITRGGSQTSNPDNLLTYVPENIFLFSIYIPLVIAWAYGLIGAFGIYLYQRYTSGVIYKQSLIWLTAGLILLVVASTARNVTNFIVGLTGQQYLIADFSKIVVIFILGVSALLVIRHGFRLLMKIEKI
jgi:hypothetical protein